MISLQLYYFYQNNDILDIVFVFLLYLLHFYLVNNMKCELIRFRINDLQGF